MPKLTIRNQPDTVTRTAPDEALVAPQPKPCPRCRVMLEVERSYVAKGLSGQASMEHRFLCPRVRRPLSLLRAHRPLAGTDGRSGLIVVWGRPLRACLSTPLQACATRGARACRAREAAARRTSGGTRARFRSLLQFLRRRRRRAVLVQRRAPRPSARGARPAPARRPPAAVRARASCGVSSPTRSSRCGLLAWPFTSTLPPLQAFCASERVLKRQATSSQTSSRTCCGPSARGPARSLRA